MLGHSSTILDLPCLLIISFSQCLVSGTAAVYEIWLFARFWIYLHCSSVVMSCFRVNIFTSFCLLWQRTKYCICTMKDEIEQIYLGKIKILCLNLTSLMNRLKILAMHLFTNCLRHNATFDTNFTIIFYETLMKF